MDTHKIWYLSVLAAMGPELEQCQPLESHRVQSQGAEIKREECGAETICARGGSYQAPYGYSGDEEGSPQGRCMSENSQNISCR